MTNTTILTIGTTSTRFYGDIEFAVVRTGKVKTLPSCRKITQGARKGGFTQIPSRLLDEPKAQMAVVLNSFGGKVLNNKAVYLLTTKTHLAPDDIMILLKEHSAGVTLGALWDDIMSLEKEDILYRDKVRKRLVYYRKAYPLRLRYK